MQWSKPDFEEITLGMEVTGYVNIDGDLDVNAKRNLTTEDAEDAEEHRGN